MTTREKLMHDIGGLRETIRAGWREVDQEEMSQTERKAYVAAIHMLRDDLGELLLRLQTLKAHS